MIEWGIVLMIEEEIERPALGIIVGKVKSEKVLASSRMVSDLGRLYSDLEARKPLGNRNEGSMDGR